jgi:hypothetical protein
MEAPVMVTLLTTGIVPIATEAPIIKINKKRTHQEAATPGLVFREIRKPSNPSRIRTVCNVTHAAEDKCYVCLSLLDGAHLKTECGHCYHKHCIEKWCDTVDPEDKDDDKKAPLCPACRTPVKRQMLAAIVNS